jgi:hypothetical protein
MKTITLTTRQAELVLADVQAGRCLADPKDYTSIEDFERDQTERRKVELALRENPEQVRG